MVGTRMKLEHDSTFVGQVDVLVGGPAGAPRRAGQVSRAETPVRQEEQKRCFHRGGELGQADCQGQAVLRVGAETPDRIDSLIHVFGLLWDFGRLLSSESGLPGRSSRSKIAPGSTHEQVSFSGCKS
jgi:hypothetical protein